MSNIKPFNDQHDWKEKTNFPSHKKDWKNFEFNDKTIDLNDLFVYTKKIRLAYKSKYNNKRRNQVILLMITDGKNSIILL